MDYDAKQFRGNVVVVFFWKWGKMGFNLKKRTTNSNTTVTEQSMKIAKKNSAIINIQHNDSILNVQMKNKNQLFTYHFVLFMYTFTTHHHQHKKKK